MSIHAMEPGYTHLRVTDNAGNDMTFPVLVQEQVVYVENGGGVTLPMHYPGYELREIQVPNSTFI